MEKDIWNINNKKYLQLKNVPANKIYINIQN